MRGFLNRFNRRLETQWGGKKGKHPAIIIEPENPKGDLVLRSEACVQSFINFQRHEYHYKAENKTGDITPYCNMRVEWVAPKITWSYLSPGTTDIIRQSFFSPQQVITTANADVLAGMGSPCRARQVRGEQADAYVTWPGDILNALISIWPFIKDVLKDGSFTQSSSITWEDSVSIQIQSMVRLGNPSFHYELTISNQKQVPVLAQIEGLMHITEGKRFDIHPGNSRRWAFASQLPPAETLAIFEYQVPGWEQFGYTRFPIAVLVPGIPGPSPSSVDLEPDLSIDLGKR